MSDTEFEEIYTAYQSKIRRYFTRMVGLAEAEDLTQDVFIKVSRSLKEFRGEAQLSTWIYRIATNTAIDKMRSPSFQRTVTESALVQSAGESDSGQVANYEEWASASMRSVDQIVMLKAGSDCVRSFVANLPEAYRSVLILSEYEDMKNEQIAAVLGVSLDTVKIRLHRARAKLKKELECHCELYYDEWNDFVCDQRKGQETLRLL